MARIPVVLMALIIAFMAKGQTDTLSISETAHELQEIVVKSNVASTSVDKSVYLPTCNQKNAATDAVGLLQQMMIPQLNIDPMTEAVRTISNEDVSVFIDFMPATKEDLLGMNTQDVKRVEIYDFPKDVRFQNKAHVVNFIMQKYEIGGYTKVTSTETILADFTANNSVYSKLSRKSWMFDANISYNFLSQNHIGNVSEEIFKLPAETIKRTERSYNGSQDKGTTSVSLRAIYNTDKIQLSNRLELLDNNIMNQDISGNVTYQPAVLKAANTASHLSAHEITPTYIGDWSFTLPKNWSLNITPELMFMNNRVKRDFKEGEYPTIDNNIKENMCFTTWQALLSRTFSQKHTLTFIHYGDKYYSKMDYSGSTNADSRVVMLSLGQGARYSFSIPKLNFSTYFVFCHTRKNLDGIKQSNWFPAANLSASLSPNGRNSLLFQFVLVNMQADGAKCNPIVMKENELMYYSGNVSLKDYSQAIFILQHTWMPSNKFTMATFARQFHYHNYYANTWMPTNSGTAIIRNFGNVGNLNVTSFGSNITLRQLEGNLQINASSKLNLYNTTGMYANKKTTFIIDLRASYYLDQFYFTSGYQTPENAYDQLSNAWQRNRASYYIIVGWGNAHWKTRLDFINPFRNDWRSTHTDIMTPCFIKTSDAFNSSSHQRLTLTLTYIFNYGKKVKQGNELGPAMGGQSSIL